MSKHRILMVGAHPDDHDLRAGGLAALHLARGADVKFISLTDGCRGHHEMTCDETRARRYAETQELAAKMGLSYDVWDVPDGELMPTLENRRRLVREIRAFAPDLVLTHRSCDYHPDHRNAAILVQDASYLLIVPNFCPEVKALKKTPVIAYYFDRFDYPPFRPDYVVPIDTVIEKKFEMMHCHKSQFYEWLPFSEGSLDEVPVDDEARFAWLHTPRYDKALCASGKRFGKGECRFGVPAEHYRYRLIEEFGAEVGENVRFAEAFMISEYSGKRPAEEMKALFCL